MSGRQETLIPSALLFGISCQSVLLLQTDPDNRLSCPSLGDPLSWSRIYSQTLLLSFQLSGQDLSGLSVRLPAVRLSESCSSPFLACLPGICSLRCSERRSQPVQSNIIDHDRHQLTLSGQNSRCRTQLLRICLSDLPGLLLLCSCHLILCRR